MAGLRAIGAAAVAMLVFPTASHAAVVQLRLGNQYDASAAELVVTALPGETNRLSLLRRPDGTVEVGDAGAPLYPGPNCIGGGNRVECAVPLTSELSVAVSAGDGDDEVSLEGLTGYTSGGVTAGGGDDIVLGGPGADGLTGNAGDDRLAGGAGDDEFLGGAGADVVRGGSGLDTAGYWNQEKPVSVTLDDRPDDGADGEGDDVGLDVENVVGGDGADRLQGSSGANRLEGRNGDDHVLAGAGDDTLVADSLSGGRLDGGPGRDVFVPGTRSRVDARDGEVDRVRCDSGLARPLRADAVDLLRGCVPEADIQRYRAPVTASGRVTLRIRCQAIGQPCRFEVEIRHGGHRFARETLRVEAPRETKYVRLNARGRQLVGQSVRQRVSLRYRSVRTAPPRSKGRRSTTSLLLERSP